MGEAVGVRKGTGGGSCVTAGLLPAQELNMIKMDNPATILGMGRLYTFHLPPPSGCAKLS
jgi:hypothetical protein